MPVPPKPYPWPASRLSTADMQLLVRTRQQTGKPITVLIQEAIHDAYGDDT